MPVKLSDPPSLVGRFAPSPTGELHIGHARSFLLAWWSARSRGGRMHLRIEDLDAERSRPEFIEQILTDLRWLGLDWDGEPQIQSTGLQRAFEALEDLIEQQAVYPCTCTRRELQTAVAAPHEGGPCAEPTYPGTCRGLYSSLQEAETASGRQAAWRLTVPKEPIKLHDRILGHQSIDLTQNGGDFLVTRRAGGLAYQLAVVVDDAAAGVTEVLRGDDLMVSAARQALLMDTLGLARPVWAHVPLVLDRQGSRLAKRDHALSLAALRADGVPAYEIVAWAAHSSGQPVKKTPLASDVLADFHLDRLPTNVVCSPFSDPTFP